MTTTKTFISPVLEQKLNDHIEYLVSTDYLRVIKKVTPYLYIDQYYNKDFIKDELYLYLLKHRLHKLSVGKLVLVAPNKEHELHFYFDLETMLNQKEDYLNNCIHIQLQYNIKQKPLLQRDIVLNQFFYLAHQSYSLNEECLITILGRDSKLHLKFLNEISKKIVTYLEEDLAERKRAFADYLEQFI